MLGNDSDLKNELFCCSLREIKIYPPSVLTISSLPISWLLDRINWINSINSITKLSFFGSSSLLSSPSSLSFCFVASLSGHIV